VRELLNEPSYHQYIGDRGVRTDAQAWDYLRERYLSSYAKHGFGMWRVASRVDDTPVGLCGLAQRDYLDAPDVGFAFLERYAGRGYATESSLEVARYAREELKLTRLLGITSRDNAGSQRVLTKIGLRFDRVIQAPGIAKEMMLFVG
jgi:RimJ/RimL family protein N-acetyltransferase